MADTIFCNYKGKKKEIYLYQKYEAFIYHLKNSIGIGKEINDLKFYIILNDSLSIDIVDQNSYQEFILNDPNLKEIFCESITSNKKIKGDEEQLFDIIKNLEDKIVKLNDEKLEIIKNNEELKKEKKQLQNKFDNYQKEANETIKNLTNEINNLRTRINNEKNINLNLPSGNELNYQNLNSRNENRIIKKIDESKEEEITKKKTESQTLIDSNESTCDTRKILGNKIYKIYELEYNLISHELKSNSKNHQYIKGILQIKNNGTLILPKNCFLMNNPYVNESDLLIKETKVNIDIINLNQVVEIPIHLYKKNKVINEGNHIFNFVLYNKKTGIIGKGIEINIQINNKSLN